MNENIALEELNKTFEKYLDPFTQEEKKELVEKFVMAHKDLKKIKSRTTRRELQEYIDDLKMDLGWTLMDCREYERGLAFYNSLSWKTHGEMKYNGMARALTEMGHYDEAMRLLKRGLRIYPDSYALWVAMGALCDELGDQTEALRCFETAILYAPEDNSTGLYNKALLLTKLGNYADAVPIIGDLMKRYPEDPKYFTERGYCALEMGYPEEALGYYQRAMEIWRSSQGIYEGISVYSGLCSAYLELGMKKEAIEIAVEGLKRFPDGDPVLYHNTGAAFWEMGWRREAVEVLKKGIEKFPGDEELKKFLKEAEDDTDDPEGGEKPPLLGLILLVAILRKKLRKK